MNILKIEKNVPMPEERNYGGLKYQFLERLDVGDSFVVDSNTSDFSPKETQQGCYTYSSKLRAKGGRFRNFRISARLESGTTKRPRSVRIWRVA